MVTISSPDGTRIAAERAGSGPPLVLVHGTSASRARWQRTLHELARHFSVWALDRRGYGESGDGQVYDIEREFEDIAAVLAAAAEAGGAPASLLGHSFGALLALEAAARAPQLGRLALYEPAFGREGAPLYPPGAVERMQALLDAGGREAVVEMMFRELAGASEAELRVLKSLPTWPARVRSAHAVPRETRAEAQYVFEPRRFQALRSPDQLLLGGDSPAFIKACTQAIHEALPNSRIAVMPGQQHIAMDTAPEMFLRQVVGFLAPTP